MLFSGVLLVADSFFELDSTFLGYQNTETVNIGLKHVHPRNLEAALGFTFMAAGLARVFLSGGQPGGPQGGGRGGPKAA